MAELKNCPFCGYDADLRIYYKEGQAHHNQLYCYSEPKGKEYIIKCRKCNASMKCSTEARAIKAWNRRVNDDFD